MVTESKGDAPYTPDELFSLACAECGCADPNCGITITPHCHPDAGVDFKFYKATRMIVVACHTCEAEVAMVDLSNDKPTSKEKVQ